MPSRRSAFKCASPERTLFFQQTLKTIVVINGPYGFPNPIPRWFYADLSNKCYCTTYWKHQKVVNLRRDPRATLLLETRSEYQKLKGHVVRTIAEIIDDYDLVFDTLKIIRQLVSRFAMTVSQEQSWIQSALKHPTLTFIPTNYVSWDH